MLQRTHQLFKTLADKNRLRIFHLLQKRKMCVCELAHILGVTQPSISRHLKRMKDVGLIKTEKDGFWTNYSLRKGNKQEEEVFRLTKLLLKEDKLILSDLSKVSKIDRTKLCCR